LHFAAPGLDCAEKDELKNTWARLEAFALLFDSDEYGTIDQFFQKSRLKSHVDSDLIEHAKMAVAKVLSSHENTAGRPGEWYDYLFNFLSPGPLPIRIITFNYDRSLEYFLARSFDQDIFLRPPFGVGDFLETFKIEHVYGQLPTLPGFPGEDPQEYGSLDGWQAWRAGREKFKWIGDSPDGETIARCKTWIDEADYIVILGFGFDYANMKVIGLNNLEDDKCIFASAYRLTGDACRLARLGCGDARIHFGAFDDGVLPFLKTTNIIPSAAKRISACDLWDSLGPGR
jgi:hypothetical protein